MTADGTEGGREPEHPARTHRRHRRVVAPATDGIPETERTGDGTGPAPEEGTGPEGHDGHGDQWWHEQRPPHWE